MTHLTAEELRAWYDHGSAADRARVIGHLAGCDACRKSLAMMATQEPIATTPAISVDDAIRLGYAARKAALGRWSWLESPIVRLAGAAAVVFLVIWATTPTVNQTRKAPTLVTSEGPGTAEEFSWETPVKASKYRVTVRDDNGVLVISGETTAPPFRTDASMRSQLQRGRSYTWKVESLDANGTVIGESLPATFRYQP